MIPMYFYRDSKASRCRYVCLTQAGECRLGWDANQYRYDMLNIRKIREYSLRLSTFTSRSYKMFQTWGVMNCLGW